MPCVALPREVACVLASVTVALLCRFLALGRAAATPKPFREHLFYVVFVLPAAQQLRPELCRSTYFTWFSCSQPRNSYAQTFPGARILRGFRVPSRATATPRAFLEHVFYVVFVLPVTQYLHPELSRSPNRTSQISCDAAALLPSAQFLFDVVTSF